MVEAPGWPRLGGTKPRGESIASGPLAHSPIEVLPARQGAERAVDRDILRWSPAAREQPAPRVREDDVASNANIVQPPLMRGFSETTAVVDMPIGSDTRAGPQNRPPSVTDLCIILYNLEAPLGASCCL